MSFDFIGIPSLALNGYLWDTMKRLDSNLSNKYGDEIPFYPIGDSAAGDEPWDSRPYFVYDRVFRFSSKPFYEHKRESTLYYLKARERDSLEWSGVLQLILDREDDSAKDVNAWISKKWELSIIKEAEKDGIDIEEVKESIRLDCEDENSPECKAKQEKEVREILEAYSKGFSRGEINPNKKIVENPYPIFFHNTRIYQSRSSSPSSDGKLRDFSTVQPYYITEFMVDTHFHFTKTFEEYIKDLSRPEYPESS
jgi:hypothetical protein